MLNLVLFGGPGAGKGTQAERLKTQYNLVHLSTGDMLRAEIAQGTPRGKEVESMLANGVYVPDEVVVDIIRTQVKAHASANGFIFDGFPRTIPQAEKLDDMLAETGLQISAMLSLEAPEDELVTRLLSRGKISGRADDQNESVVRERIRVYREKTEPIIGFYQAQNKYVSIVGVGSIEQIFGNLCGVINKIKH